MSGSTIGGVVGASIGYYVSGGTSQGTQMGWMIGSAVGGYVDPDVIKGPKLTDAQAVTVQEGAPRPIIYGTAKVGGNIIQCGDLITHTNSERTGKGGPVQETYTYTRTVAIAIGEGPITGLLRVWRNNKLVYDARDPTEWPDAAEAIAQMAAETAKFGTQFTFHSGSETQLPDPDLEALPEERGGGVGNVPAYRGTCYIVFPNLDCPAGSVDQFQFEVSCCGVTTSTENTVGWVHGDTGLAQTTYACAIEGLTGFCTGHNNNLRRTLDGGATWEAIDYNTSTSWDLTHAICAIWHVQDSGNTDGTWYMAKSDKIAVSYDNGGMWSNYLTPVHDIPDGNTGMGGNSSVWLANGEYWAGVLGASNTSIFQPLSLADTVLDLGGAYGTPTAITDFDGVLVVGTHTGKIITASTVRFTDGAGRDIRQFAWNSTALIGLAVVGDDIARTTDGGTTWELQADTVVNTVIFARGRFYRGTNSGVDVSDDGLTWTNVDTDGAGVSILATDGYSVLGTAQTEYTTALPSAFVIPDLASGWHLDASGNVVGDVNYSTTRCIADVDDTVLDICTRVGLTAAQLDLTQLAGLTFRGLVITQMPANEALKPLQSTQFFDLPEWGDYTDSATKLRAIVRGGASVATLTEDDFVESDDDEETRPQAVEFYRKVNLITSDVDSDYNPTKQTAARRTDNIKAVGELSLTLPLCTVRTEAAQIADKLHKVQWEQAQGTLKRELPAEFERLTPSDPLTYDSKRWLLTKTERGDGTVKIEAVRDRISAYSSTATPTDALGPSLPPVSLRGPTAFAAANLPSLTTSQNTPGMVVFVCGQLDGWIGCDLYLSVDDGVTETLVATILGESTMGALTTNCDASTGPLTTTVLHRHTLESVTAAQLAAGANSCAVITSNVSEVLRFETATETADGVYSLSDLQRGDLATTAALHYTGNKFAMLDGNYTFIPIDVRYAGRTLIFRPVSRGTFPANNPTYSVVYTPLFTSSVADFYTDAFGEIYTDASGAYYYKVA